MHHVSTTSESTWRLARDSNAERVRWDPSLKSPHEPDKLDIVRSWMQALLCTLKKKLALKKLYLCTYRSGSSDVPDWWSDHTKVHWAAAMARPKSITRVKGGKRLTADDTLVLRTYTRRASVWWKFLLMCVKKLLLFCVNLSCLSADMTTVRTPRTGSPALSNVQWYTILSLTVRQRPTNINSKQLHKYFGYYVTCRHLTSM